MAKKLTLTALAAAALVTALISAPATASATQEQPVYSKPAEIAETPQQEAQEVPGQQEEEKQEQQQAPAPEQKEVENKPEQPIQQEQPGAPAQDNKQPQQESRPQPRQDAKGPVENNQENNGQDNSGELGASSRCKPAPKPCEPTPKPCKPAPAPDAATDDDSELLQLPPGVAELHYPETSNEAVNKHIKKHVDRLVSDFAKSALKVDGGHGALLKLNYEGGFLNPHIISFRFDVSKKLGEGYEPEQSIFTKTFNLNKGKEVDVKDMFAQKDFLEYLSNLVRKDLAGTAPFKDNPELLEAGTEPKAKNFENIFAHDGTLFIVFPAGQITNDTHQFAIALDQHPELLKEEFQPSDEPQNSREELNEIIRSEEIQKSKR